MANGSYGDAARDQLRALITTIDNEMLPATPALQASWRELVKVLALEPAPAMRECPVCHGRGFRDASRCSVCWSKLEALPPLAATVPATIAESGSAV